MKKNILLFAILLSFFSFTALAQSAKPVRVAIVNADTVEVQAGFSPNPALGLSTSIKASDFFVINNGLPAGNYGFYKKNDKGSWIPQRDREGKILLSSFKPSSSYVVLVKREDFEVLEFPNNELKGPSYGFINRSGLELDIQLGNEWNQSSIVSVEKMKNGTHSTLVSTERQHEMGIFWKEPVMEKGITRYEGKDKVNLEMGNTLILVFLPKVPSLWQPLKLIFSPVP